MATNTILRKVVKTDTSAYILRFTDAQRGFEASRGLSLEALSEVAGRWLLVNVRHDDEGERRLFISPANFRQGGQSLLEGSFRLQAVATSSGFWTHNLDTGYSFCTTCGAIFKDRSHKCGERVCNNCGQILTGNEAKYDICEDCAMARYRRVYGYHGRPNRNAPTFERPRFRGKYLHIGTEIEIDHEDGFDSDDVARLGDIINKGHIFNPFAYFEDDCSIGGVETITAPTTLKGYNAKADIFDRFYTDAKRYGGVFERRNGLHFHLDRQYFGAYGSEEQAKCLVLLGYMIYKYYDFWQMISGRRADGFYYAKGKSEAKGLLSAYDAVRSSGHYDAINNDGANTIELRFFGGAIETGEEFLACVDIVNALGRWAKSASFGQGEKATPSAIVRYIQAPRRVLEFVRKDIPQSVPKRGAVYMEFIKALTNKINGGIQ